MLCDIVYRNYFSINKMSVRATREFTQQLIVWQKAHGRHHLPWQVSDPYRIWLSEIMLQQTQVATVLGYYDCFLKKFPTLSSLAQASIDDVLVLWSGLGYYNRAHYLHQTAQKIMSDFQGIFPTKQAILETLPGIGRSTAAAITVFATGQKATILDGNVKRVLARVFGIEKPLDNAKTLKDLWELAEALLPTHPKKIIPYTQGLMDLGATVCKRTQPFCTICPMLIICEAGQHQKTDVIPAKKTRKKMPMRHTIMLLAIFNKKIYLIKRPKSGIWAGLFSLPEQNDIIAIKALANQLGTYIMLPKWPKYPHTFTHFNLVISPQPIKIIALKPPPENLLGQWFDLEKALLVALPTPIHQLLIRLQKMYI